MTELHDFPEELLDRILALSVIPRTSPPRPSWHPPSQNRLSPLLTSHRLCRIATPHLYHTLHLSDPHTTQLLLTTLHDSPSLAAHVRVLHVDGFWPEVPDLLRVCAPAAIELDLMLDNLTGPVGDADRLLVDSFKAMKAVKHFTLRKPSNMYLSLPRLRFIIMGLARAIDQWPNLETANIAFKLSDDTPTSPIASSSPIFSSFTSPIHQPPPPPHPFSVSAAIPPTMTTPTPTQNHPPGPISALTQALSRAPSLHTFATHLPSVWNLAILTISTNPRLQRLVLVDPRARPAAPPGPAASPPSGLGLGIGLDPRPDPAPTTTAPAASYTHTPAPAQKRPQPRSPRRGTPLSPIQTTNCVRAPACGPPCASPRSAAPASAVAMAAELVQPPQGVVVGTGLFLMEARKHARLSELIRAGTVVVRGRASTLAVGRA